LLAPGYLLVISKVVPKIWARTNSAIFESWGLHLRQALLSMSVIAAGGLPTL